MPFRSKKQMKACFASHGFNGKVNCDEWAKATSNIDSLPNQAKDGGCMECGGTYQMGGSTMPKQQDYPDYESWQQAMDDWMAQRNPDQATPNINIGMMSGDTTLAPDSQQLAAAPTNPAQDAINKGITRDPGYYHNGPGSTTQNPPKQSNNPYQTLQNIGLGLKTFRTALGEIAGRVERGRQNKYDYLQQTALGQMNPMPTNDFQPNPYNLYMEYGGNLNHIMKDYNQFSNDAQFDFGSGDDDQGMMKKGGYEIDRMLVLRKFLPELLKFGRLGTGKYRTYKKGGLSRSADYGSASHPYPSVDSSDFAGPNRSYPIPTHADAVDALRLAHLHGDDAVIAHIHAKYADLLYGGHPQYQQGGLNLYTQSNTPQGAITTTGQSSLAKLTPQQIQALASQYGFRTDTNENLQQDLFGYALKNQPQAYNAVMNKYGPTNAGSVLDGILGARTAELLQSLPPPANYNAVPPIPAQAALTENLYNKSNMLYGRASQKYRDSQGITDAGVVSPEYVDFQQFKPNSTTFTGPRYKIPYDAYTNQVTAGTTTVQNPDAMAPYMILPDQARAAIMNQSNPLGPVAGKAYGGYNSPYRQMKKGGKWIQNAVNPAHKGYCSPMSKSTCTPRRRALAETFKKHHGFH